LRRRPAGGQTTIAGTPDAPETTFNAPDPDRPRLSHGRPADLPAAPNPKEMLATPVDLRQMVAVSDVRRDDTQTFHYEWADPADAARVQGLLEQTAQGLLVKAAGTTPAKGSSTDPTSQKRDVGHPAATSKSARGKRSGAAAQPKLPDLEDVSFHAFALTYGGGATLVLTAHTAGDDTGTEAATRRDVAVIALEDIYGKVQVLWSSITDAAHLDETPRMRLVDAVDVEGKGRADLLFEARTAQDRRFVLLRVGSGEAERVFATDPMAMHGAGKSGPGESANP
jgi:hypothetical protein